MGIKTEELRGLLFDIQGFSVYDGPGCRTVLFLKGCSLNCKWCSNPEGINPVKELIYNVSKCSGDRLCTTSCTKKAINVENDRIRINRLACIHCEDNFTCAKKCSHDALKTVGKYHTLSEILSIIKRDREYWGDNGGITLTGGEPFYQYEFAHNIIKECYKAYIHTAIETCGNIQWEKYKQSLPYLDMIFFDIKHFDKNNHIEGTGKSNKLILKNAKKLAEKFSGRLVFRIPVISGFNDSIEDIEKIGEFLSQLHRERIEVNILPGHHLGAHKYNFLDRKYYTKKKIVPDSAKLADIKKSLISYNLQCYIGDNTPF